jgi:hypothetical protein
LKMPIRRGMWRFSGRDEGRPLALDPPPRSRCRPCASRANKCARSERGTNARTLEHLQAEQVGLRLPPANQFRLVSRESPHPSSRTDWWNGVAALEIPEPSRSGARLHDFLGCSSIESLLSAVEECRKGTRDLAPRPSRRSRAQSCCLAVRGIQHEQRYSQLALIEILVQRGAR